MCCVEMRTARKFLACENRFRSYARRRSNLGIKLELKRLSEMKISSFDVKRISSIPFDLQLLTNPSE